MKSPIRAARSMLWAATLLVAPAGLTHAAEPNAETPEPNTVVRSIHQDALDGRIDEAPAAVGIEVGVPPQRQAGPPRIKTGIVYGYFPAGYSLDKIKGWESLTHLVYFGPHVGTSGSFSNAAGLGGEAYRKLREETRARGILLLIGLINFNTAANPNSVAQLLDNRATVVPKVAALVKQHDADGVSYDFEVVPESRKQSYVDFLAESQVALKADNPSAHVSSAIAPPTGWKGYDYVGILQHSDSAFVMAYDYHWQGGPKAGPVTPKNDGTFWGGINLETSLDKLVTQAGELRSGLVIGLPWYGYNWPVTGAHVPANTVSRPEHPAFAQTYQQGKARLSGASRRDDNASEQPYGVYSDSVGTRQLWLDDVASFTAKMDMVVERQFGGIGMFQLGYEGDEPGFWEAIAARYSREDSPPIAVITGPASAVVGEELVLDASASVDPDGAALSYVWTTSGGTLLDATSSVARLTLTAPGQVEVRLLVSDAYASATVTHLITVTEAAVAATGVSGASGSSGPAAGPTQEPAAPDGRQTTFSSATGGPQATGCSQGAGAGDALYFLGAALGVALRARRRRRCSCRAA